MFEKKFEPNVYIDIKEFFDKKMLAWSQYKGEEKDFPFPRSEKGLKTLARFRGMECGVEMAEAFKLWRIVYDLKINYLVLFLTQISLCVLLITNSFLL